ncbi:MAG: superoxide dismutase [Ni] [Opitutales bacterium]
MNIRRLITALSFLCSIHLADAHCQIPCGIYGDQLKLDELKQHVETITKASAQIRAIAAKESLEAEDHQQLARWVSNKESHASKMIDEAANYFLAQRIKPGQDNYQAKLESLHHIILYAMKSKQSSGAEAPEILAEKLATFQALYLKD